MRYVVTVTRNLVFFKCLSAVSSTDNNEVFFRLLHKSQLTILLL
ncbi:hypothetical protein VPHK567_0376 [Vibrio phage K567]